MKYFTSDWHFGHRNVINYCNRPYADVDTMTKALIQLWNDTIKPEDTVYFLGDFSLNAKWSKAITPQLNGHKIMVPGNHDACFPFPPKVNDERCIADTAKRNNRMYNAYKADGWEEIHQTMLLQLKDGTTVLMSHLPYASPDGEKYDKRYSSMKPKDEGLYLLHGHLHCKYRKFGRMIDVGIDGDFKIWSEDDIIALMKDERGFIPTPITEFYEQRQAREGQLLVVE